MAHAANRRYIKKRTTRLALGAGCGSAVALLLSYFAFRLHFKLATADLIELLVVLLVALRFGFWQGTSSSLVAVANPRGVLPNWQAPSRRTCIRSVIVDGLENRQRTIGSAWSSNGSALESRLGSCPI
jgi:hypothetical protein